MSQENVEIVRRAGEAWQRGGIDAMLEFLDPGVEWRVRPDLPESGTYRGHEGVRRLFTRFEEVLEGQGYEPQEYIDAGDLVVMPLHWWDAGVAAGRWSLSARVRPGCSRCAMDVSPRSTSTGTSGRPSKPPGLRSRRRRRRTRGHAHGVSTGGCPDGRL
jgi:hypothetical protein